MKMAAKFDMPIVSFVDTPGAYPGIKSEERHVSEAIAVNLREMSTFKVPFIAIVIGEGGSGGALGISVADRLLILENAYYSVISPEGCAAILWKDRAAAPKAAEALKMTASDLKELGIVDEVIEEPLGGAHRSPEKTFEKVGKAIRKHLEELRELGKKDLIEARYQKFRKMGEFEQAKASEK
jgi:acetyl-CoA carboxylase carboxyl transferase subunit alpha